MKKNIDLLRDTTLSLRDIAEQCGYSSESYFMKQFKSVTGTTPSAFRKYEVTNRK